MLLLWSFYISSVFLPCFIRAGAGPDDSAIISFLSNETDNKAGLNDGRKKFNVYFILNTKDFLYNRGAGKAGKITGYCRKQPGKGVLPQPL